MCVCVCVCECECVCYLLVNYSSILLIVLACSVFIGVSDREEEHGKIRRLNAKKLMEDDLQNYNDWLRIAGIHIYVA